MLLFFGAFIAGVLTVLAPCVLPLLPVIIGGSIGGDSNDRRRPLIIASSLAVSLIAFTVLLKATTLLIAIPPVATTYFSGGIIVAIGLAMLFPLAYMSLFAQLGLEHRAQSFLGAGTRNRNQIIGPIIIGAALGPVFSSCSPVYGYILATILPVNFASALAYIMSYVVGLALILLAVGYYGRRFTKRLVFASNPQGYFQRGLAVLFIVAGILVFTGLSTKIQVFAAGHTPYNFDNLSAKLIPKKGQKTLNDTSLYNVSAYPAPELTGLQGWINSNPQTLASLKGKVVLIDFWTYSCINCIRTLPYVQGWYDQYQKDGLVVIGVHAPEFAFEKVPANVAAAVKKDGLTYPVALDNNLATWSAFNNQYWPAEYLIDRDGNVRRQHFGEGEYDKTEQAIRGLLAEKGAVKLGSSLVADGAAAAPVSQGQTPETYLGIARADAYAGTPVLGSKPQQNYHFSDNLPTNNWSLSGEWQVEGASITAGKDAKIRINAAAKNTYVVAGSPAPQQLQVTFDGKPISGTTGAAGDILESSLPVGMSDLYQITQFPTFTTGVIELTVPAGVSLNTFTFGN